MRGCELQKVGAALGRDEKEWKRRVLVFRAAAAVWGFQHAHPLAPSSLTAEGAGREEGGEV